MEEKSTRGTWSGRLGFVLAAGGSAIGLGNLWKFPYITYENGGGAFVFIYLVCIALVGIPIMFSEILLGKLTQQSPVGAFRKLAGRSPFMLVGYLGVITGFLILSYYAIVSGWSLQYLFRGAEGNFTPTHKQAVINHIATLHEEQAFKNALYNSQTGSLTEQARTIYNSLPTPAHKEKITDPAAANQPQATLPAPPQGSGDSQALKMLMLIAAPALPALADLTDARQCRLYSYPEAELTAAREKLNELRQKSRQTHLQKSSVKDDEGYRLMLAHRYQTNQAEWESMYEQAVHQKSQHGLYEAFLKTDAGLQFRKKLLLRRMVSVSELDAATTDELRGLIRSNEDTINNKLSAARKGGYHECSQALAMYLAPASLISARKQALYNGLSDKEKEVRFTNAEFNREFGSFVVNDTVEIFWQMVILLLCMAVVGFGVSKGIQRASEILMPMLFILMIGLAALALSQDTENAGLTWLFRWDWHSFEVSGIIEALGHAFFTLSLGMGAIITYGSYMPRQMDVVKSGLLIILLDTFIAFTACLMIFPIIFSQDLTVSQSISMLFTVIPIQLISLPGGTWVAMLFYTLVSLAALTSAISLLEVIVSFLVDEFRFTRRHAAMLAALVVAVVGLPQAWGGDELIDPVDRLVQILLPLGGLFISIYTGWFLKRLSIEEEFKAFGYSGFFISSFIFLCRYIAPALVMIVFLVEFWNKWLS